MIDDGHTDLRYYWRALVRQRWLIAIIAAVFGAAGLGLSLVQDDVYRAKSQLLIGTTSTRSVFNPATGIPEPNRIVQTQIGVLKSPAIRLAVEAEIPNAPVASVVAAGQTDIVLVSAESTDPKLAARTADAYAQAYIDYLRKQSVDSVLAAGREIQKKIDALTAEVADVNAQLEAARKKPEDVLTGSLTGRRDSLISQQALFRQRLDQLQVDAGLQDTDARLVGPATPPTAPVSPKPLRTTVLALLGGLLVGGAGALIRDRLDETIKTKDDIELAVPGLPVLALVPVGPQPDRGRPRPIAATDPSSPQGEAYHTLRTAIQFMAVNRDIGVIQITSPDAAAGKSTVLANLAVAMAHAGKRVMVVGCDLRRPSIHEFFGLGNATGFTSVLLNYVSLADALRPVDGEPNIVVLPAGPASPNPSELLSSPAAAGIIQQLRLRSMCDVILVDCPPILPVADAVIISAYVDATVVVAAAAETTQSRLREAVELIRQVDAPLIGLVLNGVQAHEGYGSYGYEPAEAGVSSPTKPGRRWVSPAAKRRTRATPPTPTTPREGTSPRRPATWL